MSKSSDQDIAALQLAAQRKPYDADARLRLMSAWLYKGDFGQAIQTFVDLVRCQPDWTQLHYDTIECLVKMDGHTEPLYKSLQDYVQSHPNDALGYYSLGLLYQAIALTDDAMKSFQKAIELDAGFAAAYHNLGLAYRIVHRKSEALSACRSAIERSPRIAEPHYVLGIMLMSEEPEEALRHLERFASLIYPQLERFVPSVHSDISLLREKLGRRGSGLRWKWPSRS